MKIGRKLTIFTLGMMLLAFMAVTLVPPAQAANQIQVVGTYVNVRATATTKAKVIGKVTKGNYYPSLKQANGWVQIALPGGKTGWVAGRLVKTVSVKPATQAVTKPTTQTATKPATKPATAPSTTGQSSKGVVTGSSVNIRSGPGTSYRKVAQVSKGNTITILKQQGVWYQIKMSNGSQGWIASSLVKKLQVTPATPIANKPSTPTPKPTPTPTMNLQGVVKGSTVNIRSGPGTSYGVVTKAYKGDPVTMVKQQGGWYQVTMTKGSQGWIAGWLVTTRSVPNSEPPEQSATEPEPTTGTPTEQTSTKVSINLEYEDGSPVVKIAGDKSLKYSLEDSQSNGTLIINLTGAELEKGDQEIYVGQPSLNRIRVQKSTTQVGSVTVSLLLEQGAKFFCTKSDDKKVLTLSEKKLVLGSKVVAIDAGHGGIDPGAIGPSKLQEKEVVLSISQKLAARLEQAGYKVILTRPYDVKVPLTERSAIAAKNSADIFVSIHANANDSSSVNGTSTYYYAPATVERLKAQATERRRLAKTVQNKLVEQLGRKDGGILQANFAVLRETTMPSILVETAYISNVQEEQLLAQDSVRETVAEGIFQGIEEYFAGAVTL